MKQTKLTDKERRGNRFWYDLFRSFELFSLFSIWVYFLIQRSEEVKFYWLIIFVLVSLITGIIANYFKDFIYSDNEDETN